MDDKFLKPYSPQETEDSIYQLWEKSGFFNPDTCIKEGVTKKNAEYFSMVLPPPNVTGQLHVGHVLEHSLQDTIVRFQRMRGKRTLWIPGTDHAAIATQSRFEKELSTKEKKSRHDFKRDVFFDMIHKFGLENQKTMEKQMRLIGSSIDWSREAFTLDEKRSLAVRTAFKKMYEDGLIYRGYRVVNWDPKGQTTISDDEIVYEARKATLYTFKYSKDFPIAISTTRPETKVGDTAVAVHPDDPRYKKFIGKEFDCIFAGEPIHIKIVADESVDKEFGTGALGVTPAHSFVDAEIATRHQLPTKQVINEFAKMNVPGELLAGKKVTEAREIVVKWLDEQGLLEKKEEIDQNVSTAERTGGIVEPLPKLQWFINVTKSIPSHENRSLKDLMRDPVEKGQVSISPDHFQKIYFNWINNLHDWCISRQIVYGHRIPVWYKGEEIYCGMKSPKGDGWIQDEDTLDTWFSSALWTFSTLGWPENTKDLEDYHPTSLINSGYEILFFWVARMIMMSMYHLKQVPFRKVLIHGIVRDKSGRKFSKSLKNGIEPEEIIAQFGTDALRMSMLVGNTPGGDINFDLQKVKAYKNFANKLWNITRFVLENTNDFKEDLSKDEVEKQKDLFGDHLKNFQSMLEETTEDIENYRLHLASEKLYHYVWHTFADEIIEYSKKFLKKEENEQTLRRVTQATLKKILETSLKVLHPFMPFITEEIWQRLPSNTEKKLLMIEPWPTI